MAVSQPDGGENITPTVRQTIEYWEANDAKFNDSYEANFTLRSDAENPDIVVDYAPDTTCSSGSSGCAPHPDSPEQIAHYEKPMEVQIESDEIHNNRMAYGTLRHEFGHVLSVGHCEAPHAIMGCDTSAEYEDASWRTRKHPYRDSTVTVLVEDGETSDQTQTAVDRAIERAVNADGVPEDTTVRRVDERWLADVVVRVEECSGCKSEAQSEYWGGQSYDSDGNLEFLHHGVIDVQAESPDTAEYLVFETMKRTLGG